MSALDPIVDAWLAHLRVERGLLPNTLENYARDLRDYVDWMARRPGGEITESLVLQHLASLQQRGLARSSQARHLATIRGLHKFASAEKLLPNDPAASIDSALGHRRLPEFLGLDEVDRLLALLMPPRDKAMLEVLYASGLRVSELVSLPLHAVDFSLHVVRVRGKGGKERVVPVGERALEALRAWLNGPRQKILRQRKSGDLFVTSRGSRMSRQAFWKRLASYARAAGISHRVYPHSLRHS
jgi:integrase/recombinase XerD